MNFLQLSQKNAKINFYSPNIQDLLDEQYDSFAFEQYILYFKKIEFLTLTEFLKLETVLQEMYFIYDKNADLERTDSSLKLRGYYRYDEQSINFEKIKQIYDGLKGKNSDVVWVYSKNDVSNSTFLETTTKCLEFLIHGVVEYVEDEGFCVVEDFSSLNADFEAFSFEIHEGLGEVYKNLISNIFRVKEELGEINEIETNIQYVSPMWIDFDNQNVEKLSFAELITLFSSNIFDAICVFYKHRNDPHEILSLEHEQYKKEREKVKAYLYERPIRDVYPLFSLILRLKQELFKSFTHLFVADANANEVCLNENVGGNVMMEIFEMLCKDTNGNYDVLKFNAIQNSKAYTHLTMLNLQAKHNKNKKIQQKNERNHD